jgi:acetate kinase
MRGSLLVLNAGSSSIKFSVYESHPDGTLNAGAHGQVERIGATPRFTVTDANGGALPTGSVRGSDHKAAIEAIEAWYRAHVGDEAALAGVGHRVVHGGATYAEPVLIDDHVMAELEAIVPLAPLHQPHHISVIRAVQKVAPDLPQIACFDTSFHHAAPPLAQAFALPRALTGKGLRRYGFHGLSYEYISKAMRRIAPDCADKKVVVAHLGNGASMCGMESGRSLATTMGFTALDGLPMGTRTGALDPGVILYLLQHEGMDAAAIQHLVYEQSGLLGVSGISSDMRALLASDQPAAKEAVSLFVYRIGRELGSLAAALHGLDAIVFTAGIGENAPEIRARVCRDAEWLGVSLDEAANTAGGPRITRAGSRVSAWVIPTDESLMIAQHTRDLLDQIARLK